MGFSSDLWDSFEAIYTRVREGKVFTTKTEEFFKKRAEIERDYAKKLQALVKTTEVERGTVNTAWNTIKTETENLGKKHAEIAEALQNQINDPLRNWLKENEKPRKKLRDTANKLIKDLKAAEENCQKKKREYENLRKAQDKSQEDYEKATFNNAQSPAVEKLAKKVSADTKSAEAGDVKYQEAVKLLQETQVKNYDTELPQTLDELEKMEEARIGVLKTCFESYTSIQKSLAPEVERIAENLRRDSSAINAKSDIGDFVREKKTGASKPARAEYEPYDPATQTCKPGAPSSRSAKPAAVVTSSAPSGDKPLTAVQLAKMGGSKPAAATNSSPATTTTTTSAATPAAAAKKEITAAAKEEPKKAATDGVPASTGLPAGVTPLGVAKALFDYNASEDGELTFKANDLIAILQKDPSGWWQGELNGKIGVFPSVDWVEEVPLETKFPKNAAATTTTATKGAASTSKREPEKAAVETKKPEPEIVQPPPPPVPTGPPSMPTGAEKAKKEKVKALYDYAAENEFEISITEGDMLIVDHMDDDGWYSGWNERNGLFGRFPSNYVEKAL